MMLSGFWTLWLLVALGCLCAGTWLTARRVCALPRLPRATARPRCLHCGTPGETRASFCGECGARLRRVSRSCLEKDG